MPQGIRCAGVEGEAVKGGERPTLIMQMSPMPHTMIPLNVADGKSILHAFTAMAVAVNGGGDHPYLAGERLDPYQGFDFPLVCSAVMIRMRLSRLASMSFIRVSADFT